MKKYFRKQKKLSHFFFLLHSQLQLLLPTRPPAINIIVSFNKTETLDAGRNMNVLQFLHN